MRSRFPPSLLARLVPVALPALTLGCVGTVRPTERPDGTYDLRCESSLSQCLVVMEEVCAAHGYHVLEATEHRARYGPEAVQNRVVKAEAKTRCKASDPVFGGSPPPVPPAAGAPTSANAPTNAPSGPGSAGCFPGTTQSCQGPGGCAGAQVCAPDGKSYGVCDCAPTPVSNEPPISTPTPTPGASPGTSTPGSSGPSTSPPLP